MVVVSYHIDIDVDDTARDQIPFLNRTAELFLLSYCRSGGGLSIRWRDYISEITVTCSDNRELILKHIPMSQFLNVSKRYSIYKA